jgi:hypothetical protein
MLSIMSYRYLGSRYGEAIDLQDLGRVRYLTGDYQAAGSRHPRTARAKSVLTLRPSTGR